MSTEIFIVLYVPFVFLMAVTSVFGSIYEWKETKKFNRKLFLLGFCVLKFEIPWKKKFISPSGILDTESGKFKVIDESLILFRANYPKQLSFDFKTPLPLNGSISISNEVATFLAERL